MSESKSIIIFMMLSVVLLFGVSLLPKSPVPVSGLGSSVTSVTVPASASQTTKLYNVIETHTAKSP